ncbi:MAG: MAPEG family protein [Herminiimonas sp.]|nr:MAPEG family protein [Herminiimonas sp.]
MTAAVSLPVWTAWTTLAVLMMYFWLIYNVGRARMKFGIKAPLTDGPPAFLSVMRVHANTVEQLVMFLPALWLCAVFTGDRAAAAGGVVWLAGRVLYALAYYRDAARRGPGFMISVLATLALMVGAAAGLVLR